jgi:hypothetical protein
MFFDQGKDSRDGEADNLSKTYFKFVNKSD